MTNVIVISDTWSIGMVLWRLCRVEGEHLNWDQLDDLAQAEEAIREGPVDVVVVDLDMASGRGLDAIRKVAARYPDLGIVGFGDGQYTALRAAYDAGAVTVVPRDCTVSDMSRALTMAAAGRAGTIVLPSPRSAPSPSPASSSLSSTAATTTAAAAAGISADAPMPAGFSTARAAPAENSPAEAAPAEAAPTGTVPIEAPSRHTATRMNPSRWTTRTPTTGGWTWSDLALFVPLWLVMSVGAADIAIGTLTSLHVLPAGDSPVGALISQIADDGTAVTVVLGLLAWRRRTAMREIARRLGWQTFQSAWLGRAIPIAAATVVLASLLVRLSSAIFPHPSATQCSDIQSSYGGAAFLAIVAVCFIAPPAEETVFRGFLYGWLRQRMPRALAAIVSAILFSLIHGIPAIFLPLVAVGIVLAVVYELSGSIWPGVIIHGLFNLTNVIALMTSHC